MSSSCNLIRGDPFIIRHSLFKKTLIILKIIFLHNFKSFLNNIFKQIYFSTVSLSLSFFKCQRFNFYARISIPKHILVENKELEMRIITWQTMTKTNFLEHPANVLKKRVSRIRRTWIARYNLLENSNRRARLLHLVTKSRQIQKLKTREYQAYSARRGGIRSLRVPAGTDIIRASHPTTADLSTIVQRRYERASIKQTTKSLGYPIHIIYVCAFIWMRIGRCGN